MTSSPYVWGASPPGEAHIYTVNTSPGGLLNGGSAAGYPMDAPPKRRVARAALGCRSDRRTGVGGRRDQRDRHRGGGEPGGGGGPAGALGPGPRPVGGRRGDLPAGASGGGGRDPGGRRHSGR